MGNQQSNISNRRVVAIRSVLVSVVILIVKFFAFKLTGSTAILTDASESIINVVAAGFALYTIVLSSRPADETHPYGHGKIDYFSAGFEGALIIVAAALMLIRATWALFVPPEIHHLDLGVMLVGFGGVANGLLGWYLIQQGRKSSSIVLIADGKHILSDAYTSAGVVIGLLIVYFTGLKALDALLAMAMALHLLWVGCKLVYEAFGGLMDASSPAILDRISAALNALREPSTIDIHYLRCRRSGDVHHIDFHMILPRFWDMERAHLKVHATEKRLLDELGEKGEAIIHPEPCNPHLCAYCRVAPCPVRSTEFRAESPWTTSALTSGPFYGPTSELD